jgi:hypothetical protein
MIIWQVIWVVLMLFWLFGGGYTSYEGTTFNAPRFGAYCLIPWACVLILGLVVFGAVGGGTTVYTR